MILTTMVHIPPYSIKPILPKDTSTIHQDLLESLTCRDASDARLNEMLAEQSQQALLLCDM